VKARSTTTLKCNIKMQNLRNKQKHLLMSYTTTFKRSASTLNSYFTFTVVAPSGERLGGKYRYGVFAG